MYDQTLPALLQAFDTQQQQHHRPQPLTHSQNAEQAVYLDGGQPIKRIQYYKEAPRKGKTLAPKEKRIQPNRKGSPPNGIILWPQFQHHPETDSDQQSFQLSEQRTMRSSLHFHPSQDYQLVSLHLSHPLVLDHWYHASCLEVGEGLDRENLIAAYTSLQDSIPRCRCSQKGPASGLETLPVPCQLNQILNVLNKFAR